MREVGRFPLECICGSPPEVGFVAVMSPPVQNPYAVDGGGQWGYLAHHRRPRDRIWPLPGGGDEWKTTLDQMLKHVASNAPSTSEAIDWLISSFERVKSTKSARGYWQVLRSFSFIQSDGEQLVLTSDAVEYLGEPTPSALLEQMRREIAGTNELIDFLVDRPASVTELRHHINEVLGTQWESDAQVKFRLGWLSILGAVHVEADRASIAEMQTSSEIATN